MQYLLRWPSYEFDNGNWAVSQTTTSNDNHHRTTRHYTYSYGINSYVVQYRYGDLALAVMLSLYFLMITSRVWDAFLQSILVERQAVNTKTSIHNYSFIVAVNKFAEYFSGSSIIMIMIWIKANHLTFKTPGYTPLDWKIVSYFLK